MIYGMKSSLRIETKTKNVSVLTNDTMNWNCEMVSLFATEILGEVANEGFQLIEGR